MTRCKPLEQHHPTSRQPLDSLASSCSMMVEDAEVALGSPMLQESLFFGHTLTSPTVVSRSSTVVSGWLRDADLSSPLHDVRPTSTPHLTRVTSATAVSAARTAPQSIFITQRSRPSSSTSQLNDVLSRGSVARVVAGISSIPPRGAAATSTAVASKKKESVHGSKPCQGRPEKENSSESHDALADALRIAQERANTLVRISTPQLVGGRIVAPIASWNPTPSPSSGSPMASPARAHQDSPDATEGRMKSSSHATLRALSAPTVDSQMMDDALHHLIGSKFEPIRVTSLPIVTGGSEFGNSGKAQIQLANLRSKQSEELVAQMSIARRERRNCFGRAVEALRTHKVLHDRLKERIAQQDEASPENSDQGSLTGSPRRSPSRSFLTDNRNLAAEPWKFKEMAHSRRQEQRERGTLARFLHQEALELHARNLEDRLQHVRGAERSRDRQWMNILSFLFSTRAVSAALERALTASKDTSDTCPTQVDPLTVNLERRRAALHKALDANDINRLVPLREALATSCFALRIAFWAHFRKVKASRGARALLLQVASAFQVRRSVSTFLKRVRTIQRAVRRWIASSQRRTQFSSVQFDAFLAERANYTRQVCQETKDFEKRKNQMARTIVKPSTTVVAKVQQASITQATPSTLSAARTQDRRASAAHHTTNVASPVGPDNLGQSQRRLSYSRRLDDALSVSQSSSPLSPIEVPEVPAQRWLQHLATFTIMAAPWVTSIEHRNGRRLGADPSSARLAALETHPLYPISGAKLSTKLRDRILYFVALREERRYHEAKKAWRVRWADAKKHHLWLQELSAVQAHMRVSPAAKELETFQWPAFPVKRCVLPGNEMRLLVLLGFTLACEERHKMAPSAQIAHGANLVSASETAVDEQGGEDDASVIREGAQRTLGGPPATTITPEDFHEMVLLLQDFQALLNLPNVTPEFLEAPATSGNVVLA